MIPKIYLILAMFHFEKLFSIKLFLPKFLVSFASHPPFPQCCCLNFSSFTAPMQKLSQDLAITLPCTCYMVWLNTVQCGNEEWQAAGKMTNLLRSPFPMKPASPFPARAWQPENIELLVWILHLCCFLNQFSLWQSCYCKHIWLLQLLKTFLFL